jgi:hypothetical protein
MTTNAEMLKEAKMFVRDVLENCFHQKTTNSQVLSIARELVKKRAALLSIISSTSANTRTSPPRPAPPSPAL